MTMNIMEAIAEADINILGSDFRDLDTWLFFKNGSEFKMPSRFEIINSNKVKFFVDVTGVDLKEIEGILWKDKNGCVRNYA